MLGSVNVLDNRQHRYNEVRARYVFAIATTTHQLDTGHALHQRAPVSVGGDVTELDPRLVSVPNYNHFSGPLSSLPRNFVLQWIQKFLSKRTHQTKVETHLSDTAWLISGVVQGSGISPLLFLIYI